MRNRLKVLRAERDWSQAELAGRLDVSRQAVNAIETGKHDPSLPLAFRIARQEVTAITGHHESVQQVRAANVFRMLGGLFAFGSKAHSSRFMGKGMRLVQKSTASSSKSTTTTMFLGSDGGILGIGAPEVVIL